MWNNLLWVGAGGAAGSVLRYLISLGMVYGSTSASRFPWPTLLVNVVGSFLIGMLIRYTEHGSAAHLLAVVGFCGGFTTFSSFSMESVGMLRAGEYTAATIYIAMSLMLCVGATFLGLMIKTR